MKLEKSIDWVFELIQDENKKLQDALVEMKKKYPGMIEYFR